MKVFCLVRYHSIENFQILCQNANFSEYYLIHEKIPSLHTENSIVLEPHIDKNRSSINLNLDSIIHRDRLLRKIPFVDAQRLVINIIAQVDNLLLTHKPDLIIGQLVDYYILDILYQIASKYKIKVFSFMCGFIDKTFCNSKYGELSQVTIPNLNLVKHYNLKLQPKFVSTLDNKSLSKDIYSYFKSYYSYFYKFLKYYRLYKNYNYFIRCNMFSFYHSNVNFKSFSFYNFEKDLVYLSKYSRESLVYVPLHFYPEAVIDYWVKNLELINYNEVIFTLIKSNPHINFVFKEHPAMHRRRECKFYKKITSFPNAFFVKRNLRSFEIFNHIDYIFTYNGTCGIEALFAQKKVICVEKPFYYIPEMSSINKFPDLFQFDLLMESAKIPHVDSLVSLSNRLSSCIYPQWDIERMNNEELITFSQEFNQILKSYD